MKGFKIPWLMSFLAQGVTALAFQLGLFISPSWNAAGIPNLGWNLPAQRATNFSEQLRNYTFIYSRGLTISVHSTSCLPCPPLVFVSCNHFFLIFQKPLLHYLDSDVIIRCSTSCHTHEFYIPATCQTLIQLQPGCIS